MDGKTNTSMSTIPFVLSIIAVILLAFVTHMTFEMRKEIAALRTDMSLTKGHTAMQASLEPFSVLDKNCTRCHAERRFMGFHGGEEDIDRVIRKMQAKPDGGLTDDEMKRVHSSMALLACVQCHDETALETFAARTPVEQRMIFQRMQEKPGSKLKKDMVNGVQQALYEIQGF